MAKKLKKIPADLVSYIQIETEAIRDANDKQMISSYCLGKLELVNWYLELLEVGSKKYIVPQSKAHLEMVRDQLIACHKAIMAVKITSPNDRPLLDIKDPNSFSDINQCKSCLGFQIAMEYGNGPEACSSGPLHLTLEKYHAGTNSIQYL